MLISQFADQLTVLHDNYRDALGLRLKEVDPRVQGSHIACLKIISTSPGCTALEISKAISRDKSQVTRTLKSLFMHGWIIKKINPVDGRSALLFLTDEGEKIGNVLSDVCYSVATEMYQGLNEQQLVDFLNTVEHMLNNLEKKKGIE